MPNRKGRRPCRQQLLSNHCAEAPQPEETPTAAMVEEHSPSKPCSDLETLREELAKQKSLTEVYINREKETRRELEAEKSNNKDLEEKLCQLTSSFNELSAKFNEQTLSLGEGKSPEDQSESGSQANSDHEGLKEQISSLQKQLDEAKQQKTNTEKKFKKLQQQHSSCQNKQTAAVQKEKDKTVCLEGQLKECKKTLHDTQKEVAQLQRQLEAEPQQAALEKRCEKQHKLLQDTFKHLQEVTDKHQQDMEKKDNNVRKMQQQLLDFQDKFREREMALEELRGLIESSMNQDPPEALDQESSAEPAGPQDQQENLQSPLDTEESLRKSPEQKKPSFWKRLRHFLGLRKPKCWKKKSSQQ